MGSTFEMYTGRYMFLENGNDIEVTEEGFKDRIINAAKNPEELKKKIKEWLKKFCEFMSKKIGQIIVNAKLIKSHLTKIRDSAKGDDAEKKATKIFNKEVRGMLVKIDEQLQGKITKAIDKLETGSLSTSRIDEIVKSAKDSSDAISKIDRLIDSALNPMMGLIGQGAAAIETGDTDKLKALIGTKRDNNKVRAKSLSDKMLKMSPGSTNISLEKSHLADVTRFNVGALNEIATEALKIINANEVVSINTSEFITNWAKKYGMILTPDKVNLSVEGVVKVLNDIDAGKLKSNTFDGVMKQSDNCNNPQNLGKLKSLLTSAQLLFNSSCSDIVKVGNGVKSGVDGFNGSVREYISVTVTIKVYTKILDSVKPDGPRM